MYMDILAAALVLFLSLVLIGNKKEPRKLFGIYSQPGRWYFIKYPLFLTLLVLRRIKFYLVGKEGLYNVQEMDKRQALSDDPLSFDAVFFHGVSQEGVYMVVGAERHHGGLINGLIYIQHPAFGLLKSLKLPGTRLLEDPESIMSGKEWAAEGIRIAPVEPMKRWELSFSGQMRAPDSTNKLVRVEMRVKWVSDMPWFMYEMELPARMLARSIAREQWNKQLFEALKEAHQIHYEQMGSMEGTLRVDGKEVPLKLDSFRDHSGGKRNWALMHRYIYQMFYLENQTRIVLGLVSQPCTASHYEMGYVVHANGKIDTIDSCDMRLWQHGESGRPSDELSFIFEAGEHVYECKVKYEKTVTHFVGNNAPVKMYERFGGCEVNGVKGRTIAEWNYNASNGRFDLEQYPC